MKKSLIRIILLIFTIFFLFILAEIALRMMSNYNYNVYLGNRKEHFSIYKWLGNDDPLKYELKPNSQFSNEYINSLGFKDVYENIEKPNNTYRILVLGDSVTQAPGIELNKTYVKILEKKLNENSSKKFEVWNLGVSGYDLFQESILLERKGINLNPDLVIVGFILNDIANTQVAYMNDKEIIYVYIRLPDFYFKFNQQSKILTFLFKNSYLFRFINDKINQILFTYGDEKYFKSLDDKAIDSLKRIKRLSNSKVLVVIFPFFEDIDYLGYKKIVHGKVKNMLESLNIDYLDLYEEYPKYNLVMFRYNENDPVHPNEEGHKIAGEAIYKYLKENNYFN